MEENKNEQEELFENYRFVVDPKQTPLRIDKFLMDRVEKASRNRIQNAIKAGAILVDGKSIKTNHKVKPGEVITILLPRNPEDKTPLEAENIPLDIRYEDEDILVVYKSPGLVVHPGVGNPNGTLVNALKYYFEGEALPVKSGNAPDRPGLVHRIDKDTSGLLVIAKTEEAMTHLGKQFFNHTVEREYVALVWGEPDDEEGTISAKLGRNPKYPMQRMVIPDEEEGGKEAITHFKVLEGLYYVSLVSCRLETGRTHQIRVHMKSQGHTLFNDKKYGGDQIKKGTVYTKYKQFVENCFKLMPRQALHARSLGFIHPSTGEKMFFETELPDDFQQVLDKWRHYLQHRKTKV